MAPKSKARNSERRHPILIMKVFSALVARTREPSNQVASLSAGKVLMQGAMSQQTSRIQDLEREIEILRNEKNEQEFANLDQQLTKVTDQTLWPEDAVEFNATMLRRTLEAENTLQIEKNLHGITEKALRQGIKDRRVRDARINALSPSQKRGREADEYVECRTFDKHNRPDNSASDRPTKKFKHATIVCVECYKSKTLRKCDGSSPCWPCEYRGKECKRMRCKYFNAGTCRIKNCTMAHNDSGFPEESLKPNHHVAQSLEPAPVIPPKITKK